MLLFSFLLACSLATPGPVVSQSDTVPTQKSLAFAPEDSREANEAQQVFRDHYHLQSYPRFTGSITRIDAGTYRLDSSTMRIDTGYAGMMGLISRGLLYPSLLTFASSTGHGSITNLYELKRVAALPYVRRFSCWVYVSRILNPTWYVFELTNDKAPSDTDMATFVRDARLTFLYQVSIII